jgi:hypothetical protein
MPPLGEFPAWTWCNRRCHAHIQVGYQDAVGFAPLVLEVPSTSTIAAAEPPASPRRLKIHAYAARIYHDGIAREVSLDTVATASSESRPTNCRAEHDVHCDISGDYIPEMQSTGACVNLDLCTHFIPFCWAGGLYRRSGSDGGTR